MMSWDRVDPYNTGESASFPDPHGEKKKKKMHLEKKISMYIYTILTLKILIYWQTSS